MNTSPAYLAKREEQFPFETATLEWRWHAAWPSAVAFLPMNPSIHMHLMLEVAWRGRKGRMVDRLVERLKNLGRKRRLLCRGPI